MQKKEKLSIENDDNFTIKPFSPFTKLCFMVEEVVIQCGKLQLKLPEFWKLEDIEELVFKFPDKTHTFKRVEEK